MAFYERTVKFSVFALTLFCIGLSSSVKGFSKRNGIIKERNVTTIMNQMDQSVDPCTDFYSFACGGYIANAEPVRWFGVTDVDGAGTKMDIYASIIDMLPKILSSEIDIPGDISTAKNIFSTCTQLPTVPKNTFTLSLEIIHEMKIEWLSKLLRKKMPDKSIDFVETVHKLRKMGLNFKTLLGLYVNPRSKEDKRNILEIRRPHFSQDFTTADTEKLVTKKFEDLEIVKAGEYFDSLNNSFPLEKFVKGLLPEGSPFSRDDEIRVDKNYITEFVEFLKTTSKGNLGSLFIKKIISELDNYFKPLKKDEILARNIYCALETIQWDLNAGNAVSNYFVSRDTADYFTKITHNVQEKFIKLIKNSKRMETKIKDEVIERLNKLEVLIVHTNTTIKNPALNWTNVDHKQFVINLLKLSKAQADAKFMLLNSTVDVREWDRELSSSSDSPAYGEFVDRIYIPAFYLASSLYDLNLPDSLNYGSFAYAVAHELTHALYAYLDRSYKNWLWRFGIETCLALQFERLRNKMPDDYTKNYYFEDSADLIGYDVAYQSYIELVQNYGKDHVLPGSTYTSRQLFWISGAQFHCSKIVDNEDVHSPHNARVMMPYANLPEFAKDFNCSVGSGMINEDRCYSLF